MRGAILRDALVLHKRYLRGASVGVLIAGVAGTLLMKFVMSSIISVALPMCIAALSANLFAGDEKDGWADYLKTMPISNSRIIGARYIVFMGAIALCTCYGLALNLLAYLLFGEQALQFYVILSGIGLAVAVLNALLLLPACYAFGTSGANAVSLGILLAVGAIVSATSVSMRSIGWACLHRHRSTSSGRGAIALLVVLGIASFFSRSSFSTGGEFSEGGDDDGLSVHSEDHKRGSRNRCAYPLSLVVDAQPEGSLVYSVPPDRARLVFPVPLQ
ncbi:ABC-2 transporter permease [Coriobacteriales bacterium OH1046]|nr:ABC-2 transporter permease [Coriobacteriales bacterium OH1046]